MIGPKDGGAVIGWSSDKERGNLYGYSYPGRHGRAEGDVPARLVRFVHRMGRVRGRPRHGPVHVRVRRLPRLRPAQNETGDYSMAEISADALALADELGWETFDLIGHSMGGMAVQRVLADAPDRVRRV